MRDRSNVLRYCIYLHFRIELLCILKIRIWFEYKWYKMNRMENNFLPVLLHTVWNSFSKETFTLNFQRSNPDQVLSLSLIHISEPTRLGMISYAVFCLK